MNSSKINFKIIYKSSILSTNSYAHQLLENENVQEGTIIRTDFQEQGKGQYTSNWDSEAGKNLLMSLIIEPFISIDKQFVLSEMMALSVCDLLDSLSVDKVKIKWPNDILVNRKKIAGILIQNIIQGKMISNSIIGLGLNINQEKFEQYRRDATSIKISTNNEISVEHVLQTLINKIMVRYSQSKYTPAKIHQDYLKRLYGYEKQLEFKDSNGNFDAILKGILPNGRLQLLKKDSLVNYDLKEVEFLD